MRIRRLIPRPGPARTLLVVLAAAAAVAITAGLLAGVRTQVRDAKERSRVEQAAHPFGGDLKYERRTGPARTVVYTRDNHLVAVLTEGARTVVFNGPDRRFTDPSATTAVVHSHSWVRLAPQPWRFGAQSQAAFRAWFNARVGDTTPDVLAVAAQYLTGTPGQARFGPRAPGSTDRVRGADFNDYLGVTWTAPSGTVHRPRPDMARSVDCSGFLRLVFGHRMGFPLYDVNGPAPGLPDRAYAMARWAPGPVVVNGGDRRPADLRPIQPGDLLFFDAGRTPTTMHTGIYLGADTAGRMRFISSRVVHNGPTFGDEGGDGVISGRGYYPDRLRLARRL